MSQLDDDLEALLVEELVEKIVGPDTYSEMGEDASKPDYYSEDYE